MDPAARAVERDGSQLAILGIVRDLRPPSEPVRRRDLNAPGSAPTSLGLGSGVPGRSFGLGAGRDLAEAHAENVAELEEVREAGVALSALDPAHIGPVEPGVEREPLLRQTPLGSQFPDRAAPSYVPFGSRRSHALNVPACGLWVYGVKVT